MDVLIVFDREDLHVPGLLLGGGGRFRIGVIDEPLVVYLLDDHAFAAAAGHGLREVVHDRGFAGGDHHLLHPFLRLHDRQPGELAGGGVHLAGVEPVLVHQLLGLLQLRVARSGDAHLLRDLHGWEVGPALHFDYSDRAYRLHRRLVQAETVEQGVVPLHRPQGYPVIRRVGRHGGYQPGPHVRIDEVRRQGQYLPMDHGRQAFEPDQLGTFHRPDLLHAVHLVGELEIGVLADHPDLVPDLDLEVIDVRVNPEVGLPEHRLRPQGGGHQVHVPALELQQGVFHRFGRTAALYVRFRGVDGHRAVSDAGGGEVGLLDEQPLLHQLAELPLDEHLVVRPHRGGEAPPVAHETEALPVLIHVHLVEELHDLHGVLQRVEHVHRAGVAAKVVDGLLVPPGDAGGQAYRAVAGGVGSHREHDVVTFQTLEAGDGVHVGEAAHVPDVQISGHARVGEDQHELGPAVVLDLVDARGVPTLLPLRLYLAGPCGHLCT